MRIRTLIGIFLLYMIFPPQAYAYLDPGTGSYFFQILIATILGGILAVKLSFKKLMNLPKKLKNFLFRDANKDTHAK